MIKIFIHIFMGIFNFITLSTIILFSLSNKLNLEIKMMGIIVIICVTILINLVFYGIILKEINEEKKCLK